jgi:hypothetical protein
MNKIVTLALLTSLFSATGAFAEGPIPTFFDGLSFLYATKDCANLGIRSTDQLILIADAHRFILQNEVDDSVVLKLSVPQQAKYLLKDPSFPITDELRSLNGKLDIKKVLNRDGTGGLLIREGGQSCLLVDGSGAQ